MFRQPPPERFINYQLQASLGAQRQPVKTKVKGLRRGRRGRRGDQFARERRAEEIFKFGETRSGLSGRTIFRQQDIDKRRATYRPDRLLALHQSSLNNQSRDLEEVKRGLTAVGTTLAFQKQQEKESQESKDLLKAKAELFKGLASKLRANEPLLGYIPHREPEDLNRGRQRAIQQKEESDAETRAKIYEGLLGGFVGAQEQRREVGYRENRPPEDFNRQTSTSSVGIADIEEILPTPRAELDKEPELESTSSLSEEQKGKRQAFLQEAQDQPPPVLLQEPEPEPAPEPQPEPEPVKGKGEVEVLEEEPLLQFVGSDEYKLLQSETGRITEGNDRDGWAETPYEFIDVKGQIGQKKKGQKYYVMGVKGGSYQIVATNQPKLVGWNTISKKKMDKLVKNQELTFIDTFGGSD